MYVGVGVTASVLMTVKGTLVIATRHQSHSHTQTSKSTTMGVDASLDSTYTSTQILIATATSDENETWYLFFNHSSESTKLSKTPHSFWIDRRISVDSSIEVKLYFNMVFKYLKERKIAFKLKYTLCWSFNLAFHDILVTRIFVFIVLFQSNSTRINASNLSEIWSQYAAYSDIHICYISSYSVYLHLSIVRDVSLRIVDRHQ